MKADPISIPELEHIWDVAIGSIAELVYLWHCDSIFDAPTTVMINLFVSLGQSPNGAYPHAVALGWVQGGYSLDEVRWFIRAGFVTVDSVPEILRFEHVEPLKLIGGTT